MLSDLRREVRGLGDVGRVGVMSRFFKTGKGEYGEGDIFYGLTVPQSRVLALKYKDLALADIERLLRSKVHEERLIALLILVYNFGKGNEEVRLEIYNFYLSHTKYINNWDLVDLSADRIVGEYITHPSPPFTGRETKGREERFSPPDKGESEGVLGRLGGVLGELAKSDNLWERRIAIVSTFAFIKKGKYEETFAIADVLLQDSHDLIQKAVGWMLREVGKRVSEEKLEEFLKTRYKTMPRTCLRYAIERFSEERRKGYLRGEI